MRILHAPDPLLRRISRPVRVMDDSIRDLAADMLAAMYDTGGVGLAAPQVGKNIRLIVLDITPQKFNPLVMVNPVITHRAPTTRLISEACLSVPDTSGDVERYEWIKVKWRDLDNIRRSTTADGLLAACIQHEIDHLNGMLFTDRIR